MQDALNSAAIELETNLVHTANSCQFEELAEVDCEQESGSADACWPRPQSEAEHLDSAFAVGRPRHQHSTAE